MISSAVEQRSVKPLVVGAIPALPTVLLLKNIIVDDILPRIKQITIGLIILHIILFSEISSSLASTYNPYGYMWLKFTILVILVVTYLCKAYFYELNRSKHIMTWVVGLMLIGPFMLTDDFIILFSSLIGFSLAIYTFILSDYKKHIAREASIKYFYLSAVSVGLILFGIVINYLIFDTTNFTMTAVHIQSVLILDPDSTPTSILFLMMGFFIFGFLFKLAAYPGHLWAADVYEGSPNAVLAFFVLPAKITVLTVFLSIMTKTFGQLHFIWEPYILIACLGSLVWGALAAVYERKIRRFVAYTSINQMGFLLIGLAADGDNVKFSLLYLIIYTIMSLNFLAVFLRTTPTPIYLTDFNPFHKCNPFFGMIIVFTLFAMAGIPPLAGFWGKYYLLLVAFNTNMYFILKTALVISMISTFYYIRIIKIMLFEHLRLPKIYTVQPTMTLLAVLNILLIVMVVFIDQILIFLN